MGGGEAICATYPGSAAGSHREVMPRASSGFETGERVAVWTAGANDRIWVLPCFDATRALAPVLRDGACWNRLSRSEMVAQNRFRPETLRAKPREHRPALATLARRVELEALRKPEPFEHLGGQPPLGIDGVIRRSRGALTPNNKSVLAILTLKSGEHRTAIRTRERRVRLVMVEHAHSECLSASIKD